MTKRPISLNKKYYDACMKKNGNKLDLMNDNSIWVNLIGAGEKGKMESTGKVRVQIDILPKDYADMNKVGEAR